MGGAGRSAVVLNPHSKGWIPEVRDASLKVYDELRLAGCERPDMIETISALAIDMLNGDFTRYFHFLPDPTITPEGGSLVLVDEFHRDLAAAARRVLDTHGLIS